MRVFEILRDFIQPDFKWDKERANRFYAEFEVEEEEFYCVVDILTGPNKKQFATVIFGKFNDEGEGSTRATNSKKPYLVFNAVAGAVKKLLEKFKIEVVVFAAKNKDGQFDSRVKLYKRIAQRLEDTTQWNKFTRVKEQFALFVLSKSPLDDGDFAYVKRELDDEEGVVRKKKAFSK